MKYVEKSKRYHLPFALDRGWTVLCGAGISIPPPTCMSAASGFTDALLHTLISTASASADRVAKALEGGRHGLRFEQIITCLMTVDPELRCLDYLLASGLENPSPEPNDLHNWIADGLIHGADVVTTNFDAMIEIAVHRKSPITRDAVLRRLAKPHGTLQVVAENRLVRSEISSLKADIRSVAEDTSLAFEPRRVTELSRVLDDKKLLVIGYSFSDSFDIVPLLERSRPANVIICDYASEAPALVSEPSGSLRDVTQVLRAWRQTGVPVEILRGDPAFLVPENAKMQPAANTARVKPSTFPSLNEAEADYIVAELELAQGLYTGVDLFERAAAVAECNGQHSLAEIATYRAVHTLPEWDETLDQADRLIKGRPPSRQLLRSLILLLDGAAQIGPRAQFLDFFRRFRVAHRSLEGDIPAAELDLFRAKVYACVTLIFTLTGKARWGSKLMRKSLAIRERDGNPDDIARAGLLLCNALIFSGEYATVTKELVDVRLYARKAMDDGILYNLRMIEGMLLLARGRPEAARRRFDLAREALNEGETNPQFDPELELLSVAAKMASGETFKTVVGHLAEAAEYAQERRFLFHIDLASALTSRAAGQPLAPGTGSYVSTILAWIHSSNSA